VKGQVKYQGFRIRRIEKHYRNRTIRIMKNKVISIGLIRIMRAMNQKTLSSWWRLMKENKHLMKMIKKILDLDENLKNINELQI
jgi:hypothetical protein